MRIQLSLLALLIAAGCSSDDVTGETANGTLEIQFGDTGYDGAVGAAIQDPVIPNNMNIYIGSNHIDCAFDETKVGQSMAYVQFSVDNTTPGTANDVPVNVTETTRTSFSSDTADGTVTITSIDARVMGSVTFTHEDADDGTITVTGTFDIKKCF